MKKVIIQAAVKTLAAVLSILLLCVSALTIFAPQKLAVFCRDIGSYNAAASFTVISYNRSKKIDTLSEIVEYSVLAKNNKRTVKYSALLISHSGFDALCEDKDKNTGEYIVASYSQYIYGNLAASLYRIGKVEEAIDKAKSATKDKDDNSVYLQNNAMSYLVAEATSKSDLQAAAIIRNYLENIYSEILEREGGDDKAEQISRLAADMSALEKILNA